MIVRDEAAMLPRCLASVRGVVDEMIVVDTGSVDATPRIAAQAGAQVIGFAWCDDFSAARNVSLEAATGDWILVMDADEALSDDARAKLRNTIEGRVADALSVVRRDLSPEGSLEQYTELRIVRLFRNHAGHRYTGRIHEQVWPSIQRTGGVLGETDLVLMHYGYQQPLAQGTSRAERNVRMLEAAVRDAPNDPYWAYQLGVTYKALHRDGEADAALARAFDLGAELHLSREIVTTMYVKRAQIALAADKWHQAVLFAERSLRLSPGNLIGLYVAAVATTYLGAFDIAAPLLEQVQHHPQLDPSQRDLITALLNRFPPTT